MRKVLWLGLMIVFAVGGSVATWAGNGADAANPENAGEVTGRLHCEEVGLNKAVVYIPGVSPLVKLGPAGSFRLRPVDPGIHSLTVELDGLVIDTIDGVEVVKKRVTELGDIEMCLDRDGDGWDQSTDCNDLDAAIFPGAPELCDGVDNNCNGQVDEGCVTCTDQDSDGYFAQAGCGSDVDCDDTNAAIWPGADETCDGIDNNCDGQVDEGLDADEDGFTSCGGDCDDFDALINPLADEVCDGVDNNCDGAVDEGEVCFECVPGELRVCGSDIGTCQEGQETCTVDGTWGACQGGVDPTLELCNGEDDNCDGQVDEEFDLFSDEANCGACGQPCDSGNFCTGGMCEMCTPGEDCISGGVGCPAGYTQCGGFCLDTSTDRFSCGQCGNFCGSYSLCEAGLCEPCVPDQDLCLP